MEENTTWTFSFLFFREKKTSVVSSGGGLSIHYYLQVLIMCIISLWINSKNIDQYLPEDNSRALFSSSLILISKEKSTIRRIKAMSFQRPTNGIITLSNLM